MRLIGTSAILIAGVAATVCIVPLVGAQSAEVPQRVFACAPGRKSVSVTSTGNHLTYRFGIPRKTEISITASAGQGNVLHWENRYASMEYQPRFVNGNYSYIVYSMGSNDMAGSAAVSGLVVVKGKKSVADMSCDRFSELDLASRYDWLPEDTEEYSAMSVD